MGGGMFTGHVVDALKKKNDTGKPFMDCLKESIGETIKEDMPGTSHLYQAGKCDGKIEGTGEQAQRDERKFQEIHNGHELDRKKWNEEKQQYEGLLDEIEKEK